jgi:hypothetical protein
LHLLHVELLDWYFIRLLNNLAIAHHVRLR